MCIRDRAWGVRELEDIRAGNSASPWENSRSEVKVDDAMLQELVRQIVGRLM